MRSELTRLVAVALKSPKTERWKIHWVFVTPHEGLTRFFAESEKDRATSYLVDLDGYWGLGWCGCEDFGINKEPEVKLWRAEQRVITDDWRCKHVIACRRYCADELLDRVLALRRKESNTTRHEI